MSAATAEAAARAPISAHLWVCDDLGRVAGGDLGVGNLPDIPIFRSPKK